MSELFIPGQTIGIIGGGHLSRMLTLAAKSIGFQVGILDAQQGCPAAQVADWQIVADFGNENAYVKMAEKCDVLTYEQETVDAETLKKVASLVSVPQGSEALLLSQDRLLERAFLEASNINIAPYTTIVQLSDIEASIDSIGFPCILKSVQSTMPGKNSHVMYSIADIKGCLPLLRMGACVLEALIPFEKEISIMIADNGNGDRQTFPIVENVYNGDLLTQTIAPAYNIPREVQDEIVRIAKEVSMTLGLQGVLNIEMFLTDSGMIYVNSLSPRPHDASNYTIDACNLSQFEAHIRGICGWPLPEIQMFTSAITRSVVGEQLVSSINQIPHQRDWYFHYYGRTEINEEERMGHVTVLGDDIGQGLADMRQAYIWENH